jgi:hypothetical protein
MLELKLRVVTVFILSGFVLTACKGEEGVLPTIEQKAALEQHSGENGRSSFQKIGHREIPKDALRMRSEDIIDPNGFGRPITAASILIPADWKTSGGVVWKVNTRGCGRAGTSFEWSAASPDGLTRVDILPEEFWSGSSLRTQMNSQCPNVWLTSVREALAAYVDNYRPGARVRNFRPRPDINKKFSGLNQKSVSQHAEMSSWVDAGEVIVDYNYQGQQIEELIVLLVVFRLNKIAGVSPGEIQQFLNIETAPAFSMRAIRGKLDLKLAEAIRSSATPNPQWQGLMAQHRQKMAAINRKGAADRHRIKMQSYADIGDIINKGYQSRQAIKDRGFEKTIQGIQEVATYSNTGEQTQVVLPDTHKHAWQLNDGTYILTDDVDFKPFRDVGIDGSELEQLR